VLDEYGGGTIGSVICGVDFVTANAGDIDVANMSLGGTGRSDNLRSAISGSVDEGVVYVVAAGNDKKDIYGSDGTFETSDDAIPAAYPEVATVSAMGDSDGEPGGYGLDIPTGWGPVRDDAIAVAFTNYSAYVVGSNPVNSSGKAIDLAAPGAGVFSTYKDGGTDTKSGTSMAAPHAAGAAALYVAENGRDVNNDGTIDGADVAAVRQALIDNGQPQTGWQTGNTEDPDGYRERLVQVGPSVLPLEVSISGPTMIQPDATCTWDAVVSGGLTPYTYSWYNDNWWVGSGSSYTGGQLEGDADDRFVLKVEVDDEEGAHQYATMTVLVDPSAPICLW